MSSVERDKRDPQALGEYLFAVRDKYPDISICVIASGAGAWDVQDYDPNPTDHAAERRRELETRAASGDRFAAALLAGGSLAEEVID